MTDYKEVFAHAAHQFGRFSPADSTERCGFLFSRRYGSPVSFVEVPNAHADPATNYDILKRDYRRVVDTLTFKPDVRGVVGILHTHPGYDPYGWHPSASDFLAAQEHAMMIHAVYHPYTRRVVLYQARGIRHVFRVPARLRFTG